MKETEIAIMAGGRGKRMRELTKDRPKSLLEFQGKPILTHILDNVIDAFGSAQVTLAVGYKAENIKKMFGDRYRSVEITYVHDPRPLEIRKRLLSLREHITTSFIFLATDVICDANELLRVAELQEKEKEAVLGTVSGATDHKPALTHALIKTEGTSVVDIEFPPPNHWQPKDLRDIHVACYRPEFIGFLNNVPDENTSVSQVIAQALKGGRDFQVSKYCKEWYHFANPEDLKQQIENTQAKMG